MPPSADGYFVFRFMIDFLSLISTVSLQTLIFKILLKSGKHQHFPLPHGIQTFLLMSVMSLTVTSMP